MKKRNLSLYFGLLLAFSCLFGCQNSQISSSSHSISTDFSASSANKVFITSDYEKEENWAYMGIGEGKEADLFLLCPTVDMSDEGNMSLEDETTKASFLGALNMEKGIYENSAKLYAPYYQQASINVYDLSTQEREEYLEKAYQDVSAAFCYYLEHFNEGRPIILAGFSQGADMALRLMMDYFDDEKLQEKLVATYAIGWPFTQEMSEQYPWLQAATQKDDTGVIISFECEDESIDQTFILPKDIHALTINPLNWKTDGTIATKEENEGACFTNYDGEIVEEINALCGAYIEPVRGALKVTDVDSNAFPANIPNLPEGSYHIYDYQFFFRNLQENVQDRLNAYLSKESKNN